MLHTLQYPLALRWMGSMCQSPGENDVLLPPHRSVLSMYVTSEWAAAAAAMPLFSVAICSGVEQSA